MVVVGASVVVVAAAGKVVVVVVVVVGAAAILNDTVAVAVPNVAPAAVMVTDTEEASDGVPLMTPVDASMDRPAGNDPLVTEYCTAPWKYIAENAWDEVIIVPAVPLIVCDKGVTTGGNDVLTVLLATGLKLPSVTATRSPPALTSPVNRVLSESVLGSLSGSLSMKDMDHVNPSVLR